jgi:hypothetical protein
MFVKEAIFTSAPYILFYSRETTLTKLLLPLLEY